MDSTVAVKERNQFSERLKASLATAGVSAKPAEFVRAFNARADGAAVSVYAARKWLGGEAIPTHEKVLILALWLGVSPSWLRFGDAVTAVTQGDIIPEASISTPALALIKDIMSLPPPVQIVIRDIVDAFLRNFDHRDPDQPGTATLAPRNRQ